MVHLQYFHEKEKKSANCEGYPNLSSYCLKTV